MDNFEFWTQGKTRQLILQEMSAIYGSLPLEKQWYKWCSFLKQGSIEDDSPNMDGLLKQSRQKYIEKVGKLLEDARLKKKQLTEMVAL